MLNPTISFRKNKHKIIGIPNNQKKLIDSVFRPGFSRWWTRYVDVIKINVCFFASNVFTVSGTQKNKPYILGYLHSFYRIDIVWFKISNKTTTQIFFSQQLRWPEKQMKKPMIMISVVSVRLFSMVFATTVFSIWMLSTLVLFTYISELFESIFVPFKF